MLRRKKRAGYSLVEILIAMAVIAIGMSGVAATLIFGSQKAKHGDKLGTATHHAKILIETCMGQNMNVLCPQGADGLPRNDTGLNDLPAAPFRPIEDAPFTEGGIFMVERDLLEGFTRKIVMTHKDVPGTIEEALVLMTVTVQWDDKGVKRDVTISAVIPHNDPTP